MTKGIDQVARLFVHDRMPVILQPEHWSTWTQAASEDELEVTRTVELWSKPGVHFRKRHRSSDRRTFTPRPGDPACVRC